MIRTILPAAPLFLAACNGAALAEAKPETTTGPQNAFWQAMNSHCGRAYGGHLVSKDAADAEMRGAQMVMHVRDCAKDRIAIPFHIRQQDGEWDRSRTWVLTRSDAGIQLKHDHRHQDGEPDAVTLYGGDTADRGTAQRQTFPVDQESIALFRRQGLDASITNVWVIEVEPASDENAKFRYELTRTEADGAPQDRNFAVSFDLTQPIEPPPAPWGFESN